MSSAISLQILNSYQNGYSHYLPEIAGKYASISYDKKVEMAKSAAVINKILELSAQKGIKTGDIFRAYEELVIEGKVIVPILKKLNYNNFKMHISKWRVNGADCTVKIKRSGNQNAVKFKNDLELEAWIWYLRFDTRNLSGEHIKRIVKWNCRLTHREIPSDAWMADILKDGHLKAIAATRRWDKGNKNRQGSESVLHGLRCPMANDRWEVDSTRVNLLGFEHNGRIVFLYATWVYDNHSGDILGWSFSTSDSPENRWTYVEALRMAVNNTGALPRELAFDRFPGHNTSEVKNLFNKFDLLGTTVTITHRAEGKQHLERAIGTFQSVFLKQCDYAYGDGVKSTRMAAHATTEWQKSKAKELKKLGIGFEQMCSITERFINQYKTTKMTEYGRQTKYRLPYSPSEVFELSAKTNQRTVESWQVSDLFWLEKSLTMRNQQFLTEINHEKCVYKVTDYDMLVRLERNPEAIIRYDEHDLSEIYVFDIKTNEFLGRLDRFEIAITRGVDANGSVIGRHKKIQEEIEAKRTKEVTERLSAMTVSPIGYWGKEADYRVEEGLLSEKYDNILADKVPVLTGVGRKKTDIYDEDWN